MCCIQCSLVRECDNFLQISSANLSSFVKIFSFDWNQHSLIAAAFSMVRGLSLNNYFTTSHYVSLLQYSNVRHFLSLPYQRRNRIHEMIREHLKICAVKHFSCAPNFREFCEYDKIAKLNTRKNSVCPSRTW